MGLTRKSVGKEVSQKIPDILKTKGNEKVITLIGNPNVGKSTVFNALTGMHQHTGNWPGKTVESAVGSCRHNDIDYIFVDLPGCYSLKAHSQEEEVSRDFICSNVSDAVIVVCDATCLERNLNLVLQVSEACKDVIVCVNLLDEAEKKHIKIDLDKLENLLGISVVGITANKRNGAKPLLDKIERYLESENKPSPNTIEYPDYIEDAIKEQIESIETEARHSARFSALCSLQMSDTCINNENTVYHAQKISDDIVEAITNRAKKVAELSVTYSDKNPSARDRYIDGLLTGRVTGFALMFIFLLGIFWITITGANYPSELLSRLFTSLEQPLYDLLASTGLGEKICSMLVFGVYRVLTWIVAVMLPPMAIFFPMFTLLEDVGYLPRIAFNLDLCFKKCNACGKQALTMCMGFGCNAAGVVGCRIIDSPRERLIAILTNSFVPCNGRFPAIITLISIFFVFGKGKLATSAMSALLLTLFITLGILFTFFASHLLSKTLLRGIPSSFTLELPPYRKPQIGKVIVRSVFDRTLFVLGRAVSVAAPAGLLIWLCANITVGDSTILSHISGFLDPLGRIMGLDGIILAAFIFGFPANEIVLPLIIMMYLSNGELSETGNILDMRNLLLQNGWTFLTALNTIIFSLMHWPCSTTCLTVKKETKSWKWTLVAILLPTLCGVTVCIITNAIYNLFK